MCDVSECDRGTSAMRRLKPSRAVELLKKCVYIIMSFQGIFKNYKTCFYGQMVSSPRQNHKIKTLPFRLSVTAY